MKKRILYVSFNGEETKHVLDRDKEKTIIGRHKSCDIVIDNKEVSRKHVAIIQKFEHVYIENISTSGPLYLEGKEVEYVELPKDAKVSLGSHELWWGDENANTQVHSSQTAITTQSEIKQDDSDRTRASVPDAFPEDNILGVEQEPQGENQYHTNQENPSQSEPQRDFVSQEAPDLGADLGVNLDSDGVMTNDLMVAESASQVGQENEAPNLEAPSNVVVTGASSVSEATNGKTRVVGTKAVPIMRVIRGEVVGREIKLEHGAEWVVGRGRQCHVQIENQKISRQHFKIIKIGDAYRLQDLGSAHGTKLNGVSISDAPLKAFDTIQAGALEAQFLLVDPEIKADIAGGALVPGITQTGQVPLGGPSDNTQIAANLPMMSPSRAEYSFGSIPNFNFQGANAASGPSMGSSEKRGPITKVIFWVKEQPKPRQALLGILAIALLGALAMSLGQSEGMTEEQLVENMAPVEKKPEEGATSPETGPTPALAEAKAPDAKLPDGSADSKDYSPDFNALSEEEKNKIQNLYAQAERAKFEKKWQSAFDATNEILKKVKKYKNSADIMLEAQTYLNDNLIGSVSNNLGNIEDAASENSEQLALLIEEGKKSLNEQKWDDAQTSFAKALNLDPNHEEAMRGFAAARAKDPNFSVDSPQELPVAVADPNAEEIQKEKSYLENLSKEFQDAKVMVYQGKAAQALPLLKSIDSKVNNKVNDIQSDRMPASVGAELSHEFRALQSRTAEALEAAKAKLRSEYQVQLADAEQYAANKQYSLARENYDRILYQVPAFDEVYEARKNLYAKILVEAKNSYQEALIYESVGDIPNAITGFEKSAKMLENVDDYQASEYYKKSNLKLSRLKRN